MLEKNKHHRKRLNDWQEKAKLGGVCNKCGRTVAELTVDHIVPVSILDMLDDTGEMKWNREDNFQMLCYPCNRFKAGRIDKTDKKVLEILTELLKI